MSDVIKLNPDIDKSSRETNCDRRKAQHAELKPARSVSLDVSYTGTSNSKKIKFADCNDEVNFTK